MGLNTNTQNISYTLNKQQKAREERQQQKKLASSLKNEIEGLLTSAFNALYKKNQNSYRIAIYQRDNIICDIIDNLQKNDFIKYLDLEQFQNLEDLEAYISEQLEKKYIATLTNFNKIYKLQEQEEKTIKKQEQDAQKDVLKQQKEADELERLHLQKVLYNVIMEHFEAYQSNLELTSKLLQKKSVIDDIINTITSDESKKEYLQAIYFKTFSKVQQYYKIDIQEQKEHQRALIKYQNDKFRNKIINRTCYSLVLKSINNIIKVKKR